MRIALIDSTKNPRYYPLALLKAAGWIKARGDSCELFSYRLPKAGEFDEIWITTLFTFDIPKAVGIVERARDRAPVVRVGGISASLMPEHFRELGVDVHVGLHPEIEAHAPDYSILPEPPEYAIAHTSRGCVRKCKFCMVPRLEPKFIDRPEWFETIPEGVRTILFYDNNWFAKGKKAVARDAEILKKLKKEKKIKTIDFNQSMDCRLLTPELADIIAGVPFDPVRFAFDGMHEDGHFQKAIRLMAERGYKTFVSDVLYNFTDTPEDLYYRLREHLNLTLELDVSCKAFPMRYRPVLRVDPDDSYVGEHWTLAMRNGFRAIANGYSAGNAIHPSSVAEFETFLGRDEKEFVKLLKYPKIKELMELRRARTRWGRAGIGLEKEGGANA